MSRNPHEIARSAHDPAGAPNDVRDEIARSEFRRLHPLTPVLRGWKVFAAVVAIAIQQAYGDLRLGWLLIGIAASIPVGVAYGYLSWRTTRFRIDEDDLRLETGLLHRRSRRVRLDRLQAVDVVRPFVARVLGLAELRLEVAGGSSAEAPLAYLSEPNARALRAELLARAAGLHHETPEAPEAVLVEVPLARLVEATMRSGGAIFTAIALIAFGGVAVFTREWSVLGFLLPVLFGVVPFTGRTVIAHFGFTVAESPDGLRLRHGLLETRAQTVPPGRVQAVRVVEPWLWRSKRWCRIEVDVAGYVGQGDGYAQASVLCPVLPVADARGLLARVLTDVDLDTVPLTTAPASAKVLDPVAWRFLGVGSDPRVFVTRRGRFGRVTDVVLHEKVQSVRLRQGPLQRRLGLASVHLDTTPGPVNASAPHRGAHEARALVDAEVALARAARAVAGPERWMTPREDRATPTVTR